MAYMDQEKKAKIAAELRKAVPAGWKYTLAVRHHSTIVCTITAAPVDLIGEWLECVNEQRRQRGDEPTTREGYADVNQYWAERQFSTSLPTIQAILGALNTDNHDRSDLQSDYHDVGHYVDLNIGRWDRPFVVVQEERQAA